jgi:hypothetical protein
MAQRGGRAGSMIDWIAFIVTGAIAYHGITYRDEEGETEIGHLIFGCIALVFCLRFLIVDILELVGT